MASNRSYVNIYKQITRSMRRNERNAHDIVNSSSESEADDGHNEQAEAAQALQDHPVGQADNISDEDEVLERSGEVELRDIEGDNDLQDAEDLQEPDFPEPEDVQDVVQDGVPDNVLDLFAEGVDHDLPDLVEFPQQVDAFGGSSSDTSEEEEEAEGRNL